MRVRTRGGARRSIHGLQNSRRYIGKQHTARAHAFRFVVVFSFSVLVFCVGSPYAISQVHGCVILLF